MPLCAVCRNGATGSGEDQLVRPQLLYGEECDRCDRIRAEEIRDLQ